MFSRTLSNGSIPLHLLDEDSFEAWRNNQSTAARNWLAMCQFRPERNRLTLIPSPIGTAQSVVVGLGKHSHAGESPFWIGASLPERLPEGHFHVASLTGLALTQFAQGWAYGRYRFERYRKSAVEKSQTLELAGDIDLVNIERVNRACSLARDLVNTPAGDLSPADLADAAVTLAQKYHASHRVYCGDELLAENFPLIHAVGRAGPVAPRLVDFAWGDAGHPRVTLVGKGVCFDSGGLDIKPSASMLLMKKDMGGAASVLGLAHAVMDASLPIRLRVLIPAVENSVSGNSYRPGDVLPTRRGLSVEIGNTDAEGRLVLADALTLADGDRPDLLVDLATLTGAARVALGPELPALFTADESFAATLVSESAAQCDPLWHMPMWSGYEDEFSSKIADLNNVSSSGFAGAIIGALFLRRFVSQAKCWAHIDMYAWNGKERPGRPVGAEPQCVRTLYAHLKRRFTSQ